MRKILPYNSRFYLYMFALLTVFGTCCFTINAQQYKAMEYGLLSGLPQAYVYSMHQDASGYLWIGTGDGLARFDGNSFEVFTIADSLCDNFITSSHLSKSGSWFGHNNGGVTYYNGRIFSKVVGGEQGTGSITDIQNSGNTIWASTQSGGIWKIAANHQSTLYSDPEYPVPVFALEFLSTTECAVGSMDGVYIFAIENESNSLRLITTLEGIPDTKIQDLMMSEDNNILYVLTQDEGLFTYDRQQLTPLAEPFNIDIATDIEAPQQIFEDSKGNLWISTFGNGLFKIVPDNPGDNTSWTNYNDSNGLPGNDLKLVFEDREENIWLGMYGTGLARLVDEAYTYYAFDEEETSNNVHSIYTTEDLLWFGTENGLIRVHRISGEIRFMKGGEYGIPDDIVTAISGSPEGDLWIGTRKNGVFHLPDDGNSFRKLSLSTGTLENSISALDFDNRNLWIATGKGVCKIDTQTGENMWFTISNAGLPHNTVNNLELDETGKVWLSTLSNAVSFIENDKVSRIVIPTVSAALNIRSITKDPEENIWVGTYGNGVFKMKDDSIINYSSFDGLISDYCYSLMGDDKEYIWISHQGGLSRIRLSDGFINTVKDEVGIDRSMEFNQNAVFKDQYGKLWFGSTSGVLEYNPHLQKSEPPPPALSIVSLLVDNEVAKVEDHLQLSPGRYDLRIQFVGINLKNPDAVTYSYKMEGLGNAWSEAFNENNVTFNKLPDGKYTFNLRATNSDGISNEVPVKLLITISRPLWKRLWFYALIMILLTSGVVAYIKRREYNLRIEKQILEDAVRQRTQEVVEQKEEIENQRDAIKSQNDKIELINQNITDSIMYARRIQQALFPPTEHLNNYFPDSFILQRPQYIISGDFFWLANRDGKKIVTVADCTGHGVPGAFMSMLGITLLNDIVNNQHCVEADQILNKLKNDIISALRQESDDATSDGMDMAICVFDPSNSTLQYAGGFNPLILIRDEELIKYEPDHMPIGIGAFKDREFVRNDIDIIKGDLIYLYSDGYEDQFGGEKDKKFSRKRFKNLLLDIHKLPAMDQKMKLENTLNDWMDGREQIDDITVMGIRY